MEDFKYFKKNRTQFRLLKVSGLWQVKGAGWFYRIFGLVLHIVGIDLYLAFQIYHAASGDSLMEVADTLSILFTYFLLSVKSYMFAYKVNEIYALYSELKDLILLAEEKIGKPLKKLEARVHQAQNIFRAFWVACLITCNFGGLFSVISYWTNPNPPYKVPYRTWFPFDFENDFKWFVFMAVFEYIDPVFYCGVVGSVDMMPVFFFNAATGLLEELAVHLSNIGKSAEETTEKEQKIEDNFHKLLDSIDIHLKIKTLIFKTEKIFSSMIFIQGAASLIILCTTAFTLSKVSCIENFNRRQIDLLMEKLFSSDPVR